MSVKIPVARPLLGEEEAAATRRVICSGWVTQGPEVAGFEIEFAASVGARHAVAVSNCTAALHLALLAVGVRPADEVITVSHSFIATANAIRHCGAVPVFVDIDLADFNIDPQLISDAITERTKAVLCVHQMGLPCDIQRLVDIARSHGLKVIEDAACAIGSEVLVDGAWHRIGRPFGDAVCFSFHPRKLLTTGDGGMITTDDDEIAGWMRLARQHSMSVSDAVRHKGTDVTFESYHEVGFNYRLTDLQAAIGRVQLHRLPDLLAERRMRAKRYTDHLEQLKDLTCPRQRTGVHWNVQSFCVLLPQDMDQRGVMQSLLDRGIATRRGIMCAHREPAYASDGLRFPLPNSEYAQDHGLIIPLFPGMSDTEQDEVIEALRDVCQY